MILEYILNLYLFCFKYFKQDILTYIFLLSIYNKQIKINNILYQALQ